MPEKPDRFSHPDYPRLYLFQRTSSRFYQAQTYLDGKLKQESLKTPDTKLALKLSVEWYKQQLRASVDYGHKHPYDKAADPILAEIFTSYLTTLGEKQKKEAKKRWGPIQHFWRAKKLRDVTSEEFEKFYQWRKVKPHTLHKDLCVLRQMLRYAETRTGSGFVTPRIPKHDGLFIDGHIEHAVISGSST